VADAYANEQSYVISTSVPLGFHLFFEDRMGGDIIGVCNAISNILEAEGFTQSVSSYDQWANENSFRFSFVGDYYVSLVDQLITLGIFFPRITMFNGDRLSWDNTIGLCATTAEFVVHRRIGQITDVGYHHPRQRISLRDRIEGVVTETSLGWPCVADSDGNTW
jgi:hypothetical protein